MKLIALGLLLLIGPQEQQKSIEPTKWPDLTGTTFTVGFGSEPVTNVPIVVYSKMARTGRVELMADDEFKRLTDAEDALANVKMYIAEAHGVEFGYDPCAAARTPGAPGYIVGSTGCYADIPRPADHYEFRGQFILVNVPEAK